MNDLDVLERQLGPGLQRTLDAVLAPEHHTSAFRPRRTRPGRRRRWVVGLATAAALTAGIAGTAVVLDNRSAGPSSPAATEASAPTPAVTPAAGPLAGSTPGGDDPTGTPETIQPVTAAGIFLPALPIDGFTLSDISVERPATSQPERQVDRYLRTAADGTTAMLVVSAQPAPPEGDDASGSITVHGQPAHIFDSGQGVVVSWTEADIIVSLRGIGVGWNEMAAYAESSVVGADGSVSVPGLEPDGFTLSRSDTPPPQNAVTTLVELLPVDNTAGLFVSVAVRPNDELATIDSLEAENATNPAMQSERITIAGVPALAQTSPTDELGTMTIIQWPHAGFVISVTSRLPRDHVLAIAESIAPATLADAQALADAVQADLASLAEIDRATLPNGFEVSVHTSGTGVNAICLHQPIRHCEPTTSEASLVGETQTQAVAPFSIDGTTWKIGWAEGVHQPVWADGIDDAEPLTDTTQGAVGTFVAFTSTSESAGVRFDAGAFPIYPAADPMIGQDAAVNLLTQSSSIPKAAD